ncbi:MAG: chromosome segregation protein SMC [Cellulosilyticaceae bacterium]
MYLDKVEIHGFKSFGDSVKLNIPQGITAVIGPNGSGKSNVADAIRWVLGEQSAKTLRGNKMEDIIFAGTEKRKSLGYAEVAMHIRNDEKELPIDYREVAVKRRVYRSGESEYFLNGSPCRLKDIQELFMDTGVGKEGYSIIGQGQIDKVLSSKPEDRRALFEEAAGIYKYKVRRIEAEKKLDKEKENLIRIHDIISEIENRLSPLEIEAEKTRQYLKLRETLKGYELTLFITEIDRLKQELKDIEGHAKNVEGESVDTQKQKEMLLARYNAWKKAKQALFENINHITQVVTQMEKDQQKKYSDIALNEERVSSIDALIKQIEDDTKNQERDQSNMQIEIQMLTSKKTGLELEAATQHDILAKTEHKFEAIQNNIGAMQNNLETSKQEFYDKLRKIDWFKTEKEKKGALDEQLEYRKIQINDTVKQLNSEIQHQEVSLKVLEKKQNEAILKTETLTNAFNTTDSQKTALEQNKMTKKKELEKVIKELEQAERQAKWLEQIKNDYEGYYQSVKQVLGLKKQEPQKWQGVVGVVADLLEVPKSYEVAIVTALGSGMQYIVTEKEADAKNMIVTMKAKGIARVTFLPRDTVQPGSLVKDLAQLSHDKGFLGVASSLVKYDATYDGIISSLLGRILIVDTVENASLIARKYCYRYKIVTLEGEVFNSGGSLSGGSSKNQKNNIFSRSRELKELKEKIESYVANIETCKENVRGVEEALENNLKQWDELTEALIKLEDLKKELILEVNKTSESLRFTKTSQLTLIEERNKIQDTQDTLLSDQEQLEDELKTFEKTLENDELEVKRLEEKLLGNKEEEDAYRAEITEKKIALSATKQNIEHISEQITKIEESIAHTKEKRTGIVARKQTLLKDRENLGESNKSLKQEIEQLEEQIVATVATRKKLEEDQINLASEESGIEEGLNRLTERLSHLNEERFRLENKGEKIEMEIETQTNSIWEQYELTYGGAMQFKQAFDNAIDLKKNTDRLKAQIKVIGNVNVNAIEEFEETKNRYDFLMTQKNDIEKAEETLMQMIDKLTQEMHEIFREQFKNIAANFSQVFEELFGGGTAFLQLTDEENILESGIEIIAKPPGKKLQNMTLLSGGERTLTAIALVFGILKLKPSPFCVLDEIEAALDDANVLRFANYLNSLSKETQFIVITHRKGTMERADTLYGVTMQERGVSKVLSIKLEEATEYLDKKVN